MKKTLFGVAKMLKKNKYSLIGNNKKIPLRLHVDLSVCFQLDNELELIKQLLTCTCSCQMYTCILWFPSQIKLTSMLYAIPDTLLKVSLNTNKTDLHVIPYT